MSAMTALTAMSTCHGAWVIGSEDFSNGSIDTDTV
jgi:hypothetical protein